MSNNSIQTIDRNHESLVVGKDSQKESSQPSLETYAYIYHCLTKDAAETAKETETLTILREEPKSKGPNIYYAVYEAMINGLRGHEGIFKLSAELLKQNADAQNALTKQQGDLRYKDIPADASPGTLAEVEKENHQIDTEKGKLQSMVAVYRQNATLAMAKINVDVQSENRLASEINGYMSNLTSTAEAIMQMNKRQ